jgi:hypothetical protein
LPSPIKYIFNINSITMSFWSFFLVCVLLGFIGSQPIEAPYLICGRLLTILYFCYFIFLFFLYKNWFSFFEKVISPLTLNAHLTYLFFRTQIIILNKMKNSTISKNLFKNKNND